MIGLIAPFCWEGIFVPLVPDDVREIFDAPVPFIVGTTSPPRTSDVTAVAAMLILHENDTVVDLSSGPTTPKKHFSHGSGSGGSRGSRGSTPLSGGGATGDFNGTDGGTASTVEYMSWFSMLPEVNADMPPNEALEEQIDYTRRVLQASLTSSSSSSSSSSSLSLDVHFLTYMSPRERKAVRDLLKAIYKHNRRCVEKRK
jgi:DENN (AEX-3) domain